MGRSAAEYGLQDLDEATLNTLAADAKKYGEKGKYAGQELAARRGLLNDADVYRRALERAEYGNASTQFGQGLGQISSQLAGAGPLADSGAANAIRAKLLSGVYGAARGRTMGGYAEYLKNIMAQRRGFNYQQQLQKQQENAQKGGGFWNDLAGVAGGVGGFLVGGPAGAAAGYGVGRSVGG